MTDAAPPDALVREIKELIIEALMLQDMTPEDIDPEAPLLVEGLGLDSIDVLELAMAIGKKYGVKTKADDAQNRHIFASVTNLARFVAEQRAAAAAS
ncbi:MULTISPECIES: phosphopantetheine-binding protein [Nannocystis]|uniref:Phosphopantetheine-binding protein n=2 Tax=Nannocystis TaxID=53 RepID=A0ABS7TL07_9BACT|nr:MULTISPECIES: phosphopantetheine-binding protein [Nannocystis]MBZ5708873.1 phosphopantetheine-binding protein [Nannocystis pusilla]MCY1062632.1 phosphopantetheine-binding protein [Nannocystis sp. SCPEA4]MDC0674570.1 phosphopantetheine-binding protein [Nannocystis radixulma]